MATHHDWCFTVLFGYSLEWHPTEIISYFYSALSGRLSLHTLIYDTLIIWIHCWQVAASWCCIIIIYGKHQNSLPQYFYPAVYYWDVWRKSNVRKNRLVLFFFMTRNIVRNTVNSLKMRSTMRVQCKTQGQRPSTEGNAGHY